MASPVFGLMCMIDTLDSLIETLNSVILNRDSVNLTLHIVNITLDSVIDTLGSKSTQTLARVDQSMDASFDMCSFISHHILLSISLL